MPDITLNGAPHRTDATDAAALLAAEVGAPEGHALALNGTVVRRAELATTALRDGDVVEVVTAVQGG